jgi:hypothetical protein
MLKAPIGYRYLGQGPQGRGWSIGGAFAVQCRGCGDVWTEHPSDSKQCACGAMYIDIDAGRFGSRDGDLAVLVYQKNSPQ